MKTLFLCLVIVVACSFSYVAGRRTDAAKDNVARHFAARVSHETNELDDLQLKVAAQK